MALYIMKPCLSCVSTLRCTNCLNVPPFLANKEGGGALQHIWRLFAQQGCGQVLQRQEFEHFASHVWGFSSLCCLCGQPFWARAASETNNHEAIFAGKHCIHYSTKWYREPFCSTYKFQTPERRLKIGKWQLTVDFHSMAHRQIEGYKGARGPAALVGQPIGCCWLFGIEGLEPDVIVLLKKLQAENAEICVLFPCRMLPCLAFGRWVWK